jgi:hypothetical protein
MDAPQVAMRSVANGIFMGNSERGFAAAIAAAMRPVYTKKADPGKHNVEAGPKGPPGPRERRKAGADVPKTGSLEPIRDCKAVAMRLRATNQEENPRALPIR